MGEVINIYTVSIPVITCIITGVITYFTSKNQLKKEIEKVTHQCETEVEKVKKQCETEINKIKVQCKADIEKIEKQSEMEIKKVMSELDKQADVYERNKQTDFVADFMKDLINNPKKGIETINAINEINEIMKK
ncbi:TPA: hypothetical protein ACSQRE_001786 [Clostridium perfringens]|nr:hypothetical protein [Clostridium perfringens]HBI6918984.1 hypothetical protein [Clostridium perfringens]HBI7038947.1 hypothetical protein [Clostridium perfringens]